MEHLIDLIHDELERANYKPLDHNNLWKHESFHDYWLIVYFKGLYQLDNVQKRVFEDLADIRIKYPESTKNTNLFILNEVQEDECNERKIIEEENDVYLFKKYVLQYSTSKWDLAKALIPSSYGGLGNFLMQPDVFEMMKESNGDCPCSLLYSIAHKLPFISLDVHNEDYIADFHISIPNELNDTYQWLDEHLDFSKGVFSQEQLSEFERQIQSITQTDEKE